MKKSAQEGKGGSISVPADPSKAKEEVNQDTKKKQEAEEEGGGGLVDIERLRRIEVLVQELHNITSPTPPTSSSSSSPSSDGARDSSAKPQAPAPKGGLSHLPGRGPKKAPGSSPHPPSATAGTPTSPLDSVSGVCSELSSLVRDDDLSCVYLRECSGLQVGSC